MDFFFKLDSSIVVGSSGLAISFLMLFVVPTNALVHHSNFIVLID